MAQTAKFITIEGIEGLGKSTITEYLQVLLAQQNIDFVLTREPGGTLIAEEIRQVLLTHHEEKMSSDTELLLMFAGRAQNIAQVILPALKRGQWVLSDRFTDASYAYQGGGRGISTQRIRQLEQWVQGDLQPDLTLLLDAPVEVGLQRLQSRGAKDRIELEGIAFFERTRAMYLQQAKKDPQRFCIIDAAQPLVAVQQQVENLFNDFFYTQGVSDEK